MDSSLAKDDKREQNLMTETSQCFEIGNSEKYNNFEFPIVQKLYKDDPNQIILLLVDSNKAT